MKAASINGFVSSIGIPRDQGCQKQGPFSGESLYSGNE